MSTRPTLIAAAALIAAGNAHAQSAPGNNIDDRVREQLRVATPGEREEALLTGDADIVLTRRTKLFNVSGSFDIAGTSNAFLAPGHARSDGYGQLQVSIGAGTRIGGKVDVFASIGVLGVRYFKYQRLDYNALTGLIGARTNVGRLSVALTYQPAVVLSGNFGKRLLTTHRFRLAGSLPFQLHGVTVEPMLAVERVLSSPSDYRAWSGSAGVTLVAPLSRKLPLLAYASAQYERRSFDGYFPDLVGVKRRDDNWSAGVGVIWRPRAWGEVRVSYSFQQNRSTSDVNRYRAHTGMTGISAQLRF